MPSFPGTAPQSTPPKVALYLGSTPIGPNDTAIAGHALAVRAILVTNNMREFARVPGLNRIFAQPESEGTTVDERFVVDVPVGDSELLLGHGTG